MSDLEKELFNYMELSPLIGMAGQPNPEQFELLKAARYQAIIHFRVSEAPYRVVDEADRVEQLGLDYGSFQLSFANPLPEAFEQFCKLMGANRGKRVFIHCASGYSTATFLYLYRVLYMNMPHEQAQADLLKVWEPNDIWQRFIDATRNGHQKSPLPSKEE